LPSPKDALDAYNESKAKAEEIVLAANGKDGLLTVALRPAGIFGPGDRQVMHGLAQVWQNRQTHFQIGDNTNLFDWTYVGNVVHAHLLAADKLGSPPVDRMATVTKILPKIDLTTGARIIPTSDSRPLGPYLTPIPDSAVIEERFRKGENLDCERPVVRSRFDQFSEGALNREEEKQLRVDGQVFFITNGEPTYFWDFARAVWRRLGDLPQRSTIKLPRGLGLLLATGAEWWGWLIGKEPTFTRFRVTFSCTTRYHNIDKARLVLGYEPIVGIEEGLDRMVEWWKAEHGNA